MREMTEAEKAYLAGIIDGEGNIGINKRPPKPQCGEVTPTFNIMVRVCNTDLRLLRWMQSRTRIGTVYSENANRWAKNSRRVFIYAVSAAEAEALLRAIYPYLVMKQDQADVVFRFRATYGKVVHCRAGVPADLFRDREECCDELKRLHHVEYEHQPTTKAA